METNTIIGLDSAYLCAQETGSGNMQISAGLVVELIDRLRAAETERQELRHAQNSLFDRLSDLTAYKEAAENQKPVQWVCELSSNPWPDGGGTRRDTKEDALKYINSDSNHCKYDTVSPIYRLPVQADNPVVAVPDGWREIVEAVAHIGVDFGYGNFVLSHEHIEKARLLLAAAPSHSQQSSGKAHEWDGKGVCKKCGVTIFGRRDTCPSHESEQHSFGESEFIPVDLLLKPDLTDEDVQSWRKQNLETKLAAVDEVITMLRRRQLPNDPFIKSGFCEAIVAVVTMRSSMNQEGGAV